MRARSNALRRVLNASVYLSCVRMFPYDVSGAQAISHIGCDGGGDGGWGGVRFFRVQKLLIHDHQVVHQ